VVLGGIQEGRGAWERVAFFKKEEGGIERKKAAGYLLSTPTLLILKKREIGRKES